MDISPAEMVRSTLQAINDLDEAQARLEDALHLEVRCNGELIRALAKAWKSVQGPNREYRQALVEDQCVIQITEYESAKADSKMLMEKVRNKRQTLSAYQSAMNSIKEEAGHSRFGPQQS